MDPQALPLIESLTPREIEALKLMAQGLMNREIAETMVVELTTVKYFVKQIYGKLGVDEDLSPRERRQQALLRAQQLSLIEGDTAETAVRNNLPAQTSGFIGREAELLDLAQLLADPAIRLITVLAPGGMGKTRLALEMAARAVNPDNMLFFNGVFFVPFQPLTEPDLIASVIGDSLGLQSLSGSRSPEQQLLDFLAKKQWLLVLDNFEHLLQGAGIITKILEAAPKVQILVTSRERLNLSGEQVYLLKGMSFNPETAAADALASDAVRLFVQSAKLAAPDFELHPADLIHLNHICHLTEGMPLAIQLAAAWTSVLSLQEIAQEIQQNIDFLAAEMRDFPQRHWSIKAVFEPTWRQLSDCEQAVFMKFSLFRGGCTRHAAQTITGADLRSLQALANKSLIHRNAAGRYEMHELLRQYAEAKLTESGAYETASDIYVDYYASLLENLTDDIFRGDRQLQALDVIEADFDNIRAVWLRAVQKHDFVSLDRMDMPFNQVGWYRGRLGAVLPVLEETVNSLRGHAVSIEEQVVFWNLAVTYAVMLRMVTHKNDESPLWQDAILRQHHNPVKAARMLGSLGFLRLQLGYPQEALVLINEAGDRLREHQQFGHLGFSFWHKSLIITALGAKPSEIIEVLQQGLELVRPEGDRYRIAACTNNIGAYLMQLGRFDEGLALIEEALAVRRELGSVNTVGLSLDSVGLVARFAGQYQRAREAFEEALAIQQEAGLLPEAADSCFMLTLLAVISGDLEEALDYLALTGEIYPPKKQSREYLGMTAYLAESRNELELALELRQQVLDHPDTSPSDMMEDQLGLGTLEAKLGRISGAREHLSASLKYALDHERIIHLPVILYGIALVYKAAGELVRAAELASLLITNPTTIHEIRKDGTDLLAEVKACMDAATYEAAVQRGAALDLQTVLYEVLAEFTEDLPDAGV